ncbi:MAG: zinc-ribbon domain-containing protein [Elusimicrobiaceae bacterium]|nr:zinc-ribbon domain-containing protein [Elusimicrobiaceae bacterium]
MPKKYISDNAELMKEWDWEANNKKGLDPTKTTYGSHKIVHWKCVTCGYKWIQAIMDRTRKKNPAHCPCCMNRVVVKGINDLATTRPELAKEWHPTKNGDLTPYMVTAGSSKRVWWKCSVCGKDWNTVITSRRTCPHCLRAPKRGTNDLATLYPEIAKEWHPTKNGILSPIDVKAKSNKKVWWKCPNGHIYQAAVCARTRLEKNGLIGTGCPICNKMNRTSFPEQAIFYYVKQLYPDAVSQYKSKFLGKMELDIYIPSINLAIEYDGEAWHREDKLKREQEKYAKCMAQGIKLIRIREKLPKLCSDNADEHIETIKINGKYNLKVTIQYLIQEINFTNKRITIDIERDELKIREGYQTKVKDSVAELYPELVKEWHPTKNGFLTPNNCKAGSVYKVWWKCSKCGYEWKTPISKRTIDKHGCLNCTNQATISGVNDLATLYPKVAKEWHPTKNGTLTPKDIRPKSNRKYWWKCSKCGYDWQASAQSRIHLNSGCPACSGRVPITGINDLFTVCPNLKEKWDFDRNKHLDPSRLSRGSHTKAWWKCSKGHSYEMSIHRKSAGAGCHYCSSHKVLTGFNDLKTVFPNIAKEWDTERNIGKSPDKCAAHSNQKVWWKCSNCGYTWQLEVHRRVRDGGSKCPHCHGLPQLPMK